MNTLEEYRNVVKPIRPNLDDSITAGYCGIPGSFGESALVRYFGELQKPIRNYPTFSSVCDAVIKEEIGYGILPVENTTTGGIKEVYDLIRQKDLYIIGEVCLPIIHNLIGLPGATPEDVEEIFSHPQGLEQCEIYLSGLKSARLIPMNNTAFGVRHVAEQMNPAFAAIGGERAAKLYGLEILMPSIQNSTSNRTRFVILSKKQEVQADADSTSIVLTTRHTIGALYDILGFFAKERVNLFRIESRPIPDRPWEYFIFLDVEGSIERENVQRALAGVQTQCSYFKFIGSYKKGAFFDIDTENVEIM
ncbi:MAG: bifunctional chorismate mutase/prephenate dehydratase [Clostridia bacterium]|nr:bifunctional chorismate mutase/prephenate dehydratase [Clostridia bacterium]